MQGCARALSRRRARPRSYRRAPGLGESAVGRPYMAPLRTALPNKAHENGFQSPESKKRLQYYVFYWIIWYGIVLYCIVLSCIVIIYYITMKYTRISHHTISYSTLSLYIYIYVDIRDPMLGLGKWRSPMAPALASRCSRRDSTGARLSRSFVRRAPTDTQRVGANVMYELP